MVTDAFLDRNPDCWMQTPVGRLRPDSGPCFGSRFLGGDGIRLLEILPGTSFNLIRNHQSFWLAWLIDICACHADNRQAIFIKDDAGWLDAYFVDHGHLFGGPKGELRRKFEASRYLDPRIYQSASSQQLLSFQKIARDLDVDKLWKSAQILPDNWKTSSALKGYAECLNRLSTSQLLQNIVDTMVEAHRQANRREGIISHTDESSQLQFCALEYRPQNWTVGASRAESIILLAMQGPNNDLRFLVSPTLRQVVQSEDLEYIDSLLKDLVVR